MAKILVIGYERMHYLVEEVIKEKFPYNTNIEIERIELERKILDQLYKTRQKHTAPLVITSDRISLFLKRRLPHLPLISVDVSDNELFKKLEEARQISDKIVIMDFYKSRKVPECSHKLNADIKQETFLTARDIELRLRELKKQGWYVIIGGNLECNLALGIDLKPIYIYGKETVAQAIDKSYPIMEKCLLQESATSESKKHFFINVPPKIQTFSSRYTFDDIIGESNSIKEVIKLAQIYAKSEAPCLITGETGTGKELFAHSIHNASFRAGGPFVPVNCTALPESLLESELFGYEEGAFTGARKGGKSGLLELAQGGTLFLDEIGELPLAFQAKLLRVLQEKEIVRLGGTKFIPINFRLIAATNKDLEKSVLQGKFREDLYYRLAVLQLRLPPLKERGEDCWLLFKNFLLEKCPLVAGLLTKVRFEVMQILKTNQWRGNVREISNVAERVAAFVNVTAENLTTETLVCFIRNALSSNDSLRDKNEVKKSINLEVIKQAIAEANGCKSKAAKKLGISRTTLWRITCRSN